MDEELEQKIKEIDEKMPGMAKKLERHSQGFFDAIVGWRYDAVDYKETDKWKIATAKQESYTQFWRSEVGVVVYAIDKKHPEPSEAGLFFGFSSKSQKIWEANCDLYKKTECGERKYCDGNTGCGVDYHYGTYKNIKIAEINGDIAIVELFKDDQNGARYKANLKEKTIENLGTFLQIKINGWHERK